MCCVTPWRRDVLFVAGIEPRSLGRLFRSLVAIPTDYTALALYLCLFRGPYISGPKFCTVATNICRSAVRNVFDVTVLTRRILM